ncbi:hypothetical protein [Streptomyces vastus]|uniref:Transposase n=1 Tax=Streptomyces vastus TaxID=285451 RepID=A0ABN3R4C8_9ACTN
MQALRGVRISKELTEQGLDAGPETIAWHLQQHHLRVSRATISRHLTAHGLVLPAPRKRPRSSYIRFQAELPNETWQADFTHDRLADRAGTDIEILTWHSPPSVAVQEAPLRCRGVGPRCGAVR